MGATLHFKAFSSMTLSCSVSAVFHSKWLSSPFRKIKSLGEDDPWLDDTAAWIERSRKLQLEKEMAEKRVGVMGRGLVRGRTGFALG